MEKLTQAYDIVNKYGISLYDFGPYLSLIKNKIGICLDIKDDKYNYLTRNFSFENMKEFEGFIKKYSYYKRVLNSKSKIFISDYNSISPEIKYEFEQEETLKKLKEQKEIDLIVSESEALYSYVDNLYSERIDRLILRDKERMNMENILSEYKYNLHRFYGKTYKEEYNNLLDDTINNFQIKAKDNLKSIKRKLDDLKNENVLNNLKLLIKEIIFNIKEIEIDKDYFSLIYDLYLFKNKSYVINVMNEKIVEELQKTPKIDSKKLKDELEYIKSSVLFVTTKESFINKNIKNVEEKYFNLDKIDVYNYGNFLNNREFIKIDFSEIVSEEKVIENNYIEQFDLLNPIDKNSLLVLFSPFREVINTILKALDDNNFENNDFLEFQDFYLEMLEYINSEENLIIKEKYLKKIDFNTFELFIKSFKNVALNLKNLCFSTNINEEYFAFNIEKPLIFSTKNVIKNINEKAICLKVKQNSKILFSEHKISLKDGKFSILNNNDIFIIRELNTFKYKNETDEIKEYKPFIKKTMVKDKNLNVVFDMKEIGKYIYEYYDVEGKNAQ